jgi:hypothetical protein
LRGVADRIATNQFRPPSRQVALTSTAPISVLGEPMLDIIMLAIGIGFFAVAIAYVSACDRL